MDYIKFMVVILLVGLPNSFAYGCSEPSEPQCIENASTYEDEEVFIGCQSNVENYISSVKEYADCINAEADTKTKELQSQADAIIKSFNCKVKGGEDC